jgi:hypothetical protein
MFDVPKTNFTTEDTEVTEKERLNSFFYRDPVVLHSAFHCFTLFHDAFLSFFAFSSLLSSQFLRRLTLRSL